MAVGVGKARIASSIAKGGYPQLMWTLREGEIAASTMANSLDVT